MNKLIIILVICILSFAMFTISYGFWTDQIEINGDSKVTFKIGINKDIIQQEELTDAAIEEFPKLSETDLSENEEDIPDEPLETIIEEELSPEETDKEKPENEVVIQDELEAEIINEEDSIPDEPTPESENVPLEEEEQSETTSGAID